MDRTPTFLADVDFAFHRSVLRDAAERARCVVHAYVLMTNHVHLLVTPDTLDGPARLMQSLGRTYVRFFNDRYHRTGTLWEGRYRSTPVRCAEYALTCCRYIELNPVRAGLVALASDYEWSSFRHNALGDDDPLINSHPALRALGDGRAAACAAYHALFSRELEPGALANIRIAPLRPPELPVSAYELAVDAVHPGRDARRRSDIVRREAPEGGQSRL